MKTGNPCPIYRYLPVACLTLLCACRTTPPPTSIPQTNYPAVPPTMPEVRQVDITPDAPSAPQTVSPVAAPTIPEVRQDDIPANASPTVREHLIKLREMRDIGQISDIDYQSRKNLLLGQ